MFIYIEGFFVTRGGGGRLEFSCFTYSYNSSFHIYQILVDKCSNLFHCGLLRANVVASFIP